MEKTINLTQENYWHELKANEALRPETVRVLIQLVNCKINNLIPPMAINNQNKFENFDYVSEEVEFIFLDGETKYKIENSLGRYRLVIDCIASNPIGFEGDNGISTIG